MKVLLLLLPVLLPTPALTQGEWLLESLSADCFMLEPAERIEAVCTAAGEGIFRYSLIMVHEALLRLFCLIIHCFYRDFE